MDERQEQVGSRPGYGQGSGSETPHRQNTSPEDITRDMRDQAAAQGHRVADRAEHAADAARRAARAMGGDEAWMAGLVEQGADRLSDFAQTLRSNDLNTLLARAEDFARRQPVLFTGAAMAAGFMLSRAVGTAARRGGINTASSSGRNERDLASSVYEGEFPYEH
ncbi:MAG TPA: hypothetical protein VFL55_03035 [Acetobacteraceae bacterium]|nr:hypothetical protein [Acetobacteraceae bacterium]